MKIICLLAPHLPVQVERRRDPDLDDQPLVVGGRPWDPGAVLDCCPTAEAAGVRPGMRLSRAEALCPSARFLPADARRRRLQEVIRRLRERREAISVLARRVVKLEPKRGER